MSINQNNYSEPQFYRMDSSSPSENPSFFSGSMPKSTNSQVRGGSANYSEERMEMITSDADNERDCGNLGQNQIPKEHLFEKPLTPSDVGKLNRLVIPKQHAEKYFPLGEKGFLLSFEDETGKSWRFRYSYWNSSQSYVLTKGWSRFVKEKRLDAGDFVLFSRHLPDSGRLFIGWRRRHSSVQSGGRRIFHNPYPQPAASTSPSFLHSAPTGGNNLKKLRLFGVNLECQADDQSEASAATADDGSTISGHHQRWLSPYHHQYYDQMVHHPAVFY